MRTTWFVYPDFQVYCLRLLLLKIVDGDVQAGSKEVYPKIQVPQTETNYTRQHVMAIVLMTCMVVVIKVHWLIIIHVQNYCDCFPFVGLVAFLS